MARKARLHVPGGLYHVVLHGCEGSPIFRATQDWKTFEQLTARALPICDARVHAYCWLAAQAHFALQVGHVPSGAVMQRICAPYARYARQKYGLAKVFQSRYRADFVDRELYLLALVRHITRLALSTAEDFKLDAYPWSSHVAYIGRRECPWLRTEEVWDALAWRGADMELAYRRLIEAPQNADETAMLARGSHPARRTSGNVTYLEWVGRRSPRAPISLPQILEAVALRVSVPVQVMRSPSREHRACKARDLAIWHAYRAGIASLAEIARQFDRDPSHIQDSIDLYRKLEPELFDESLEELLSRAKSMALEGVGGS